MTAPRGGGLPLKRAPQKPAGSSLDDLRGRSPLFGVNLLWATLSIKKY